MTGYDRKGWQRYEEQRGREGRLGANGTDRMGLTPAEIWQIMNQPKLRMNDDPNNAALAQQLIVNPEDPDLQELFSLVVQNQAALAMAADDVFWGNYPLRGTVQIGEDTIIVGMMPTGDRFGFPGMSSLCNMGIFGKTRAGKTTLLEVIVAQLPQRGFCVVAVDRKNELRHLPVVPELRGIVIVLKLHELPLSLFQPPPGVNEQIWANEITKLVAGCYARYSAQRLMREILGDLLQGRKPGRYPSLRELIYAIEEFRPRFGMREAAYKESILWVLKDLMNTTGGIFDYGSSDFLEHLFAGPGLVIIEAETLPVEHYLFLITYMMRWLYVQRLYGSEQE